MSKFSEIKKRILGSKDGKTADVRSRLSPQFEQEAMLRHCPILTDIKEAANIREL